MHADKLRTPSMADLARNTGPSHIFLLSNVNDVVIFVQARHQIQQQKSCINHVIDDPMDKNTANHATPNSREPRTALTPSSRNLLFTSTTTSPYITVAPTVAAVIKSAESWHCQPSIFVKAAFILTYRAEYR